MPFKPKDEFRKIAGDVKSSGEAHRLSVRELLGLFHQERRSYRVIAWIRQNLAKYGLESYPDFASVYIDSSVDLRKLPVAGTSKKDQEGRENKETRDPVPRLALLPAANRPPVSVTRDADLKRAITLMMMHDFSQLPVMQGRQVDGMVSMHSIVAARTQGERDAVRDCMSKEIQILASDVPLFEAVRVVMQHEVVLVRAADQSIVGLVTIADIGEQFISLAEPFWVLEQIENHIRALIEGKFSIDQLKSAVDGRDNERIVESVSDLSFGEFVRILENPEHWATVGLSLDRSTFVKRLEQVRQIRNDVMHFHPDGISPDHLEVIRQTNRFFYAFSQFRSPTLAKGIGKPT